MRGLEEEKVESGSPVAVAVAVAVSVSVVIAVALAVVGLVCSHFARSSHSSLPLLFSCFSRAFLLALAFTQLDTRVGQLSSRAMSSMST